MHVAVVETRLTSSDPSSNQNHSMQSMRLKKGSGRLSAMRTGSDDHSGTERDKSSKEVGTPVSKINVLSNCNVSIADSWQFLERCRKFAENLGLKRANPEASIPSFRLSFLSREQRGMS